mmetsp:Transcript_7519/g.21571  ORF Transcript_7519/g.21571 Transcript_7519/m.21571 type:complete len:216 (-) Transcript_7519:125-772(-)
MLHLILCGRHVALAAQGSLSVLLSDALVVGERLSTGMWVERADTLQELVQRRALYHRWGAAVQLEVDDDVQQGDEAARRVQLIHLLDEGQLLLLVGNICRTPALIIVDGERGVLIADDESLAALLRRGAVGGRVQRAVEVQQLGEGVGWVKAECVCHGGEDSGVGLNGWPPQRHRYVRHQVVCTRLAADGAHVHQIRTPSHAPSLSSTCTHRLWC